MKENKSKVTDPKKRKNLLYNLLIGLMFTVGILVLLYPTISDTWNKYRNSKLITEYDAILNELTPEDYSKLWKDAQEYNEKHVVNVFSDTFSDANYQLSHPYDQILNPSGNNIMGYIDVPKIGQKLAIGHGTGAYILERGVGHVEGTSLPIGGPSTHAVLAGHRGLPSAKIFSDLDQVIKGDKFFLYILDEVLAYEIDQIEVVEPNDDRFLQIEEGEDLVTLLTCTPYGVNSHRMLIRGHRVPYNPDDIVAQGKERRINEREKPVIFAIVGLIVFLIILIGMRIYFAKKKRRKEDEEKEKKIQEAKAIASKAVKEAEKAKEAAEEAKEAALQAQTSETKEEIDQAVEDAHHAVNKAQQASQDAKDIVNRANHSDCAIRYIYEEDKDGKEN